MTPKQRKLGWFIVIGAFLMVGYLMLDDLTDRLNTAESNAGANRALATDAAEKADALAQQVRGLGEVPVVTPPSGPAASEPSTRYVPVPGPSGSPGTRGPVGLPGTDGESGSKGDGGANGAPGATGQPGEKGADGKNGTDGATGPQGAPGVDGRDGTPGADGRGIQSTSCEPDGTWLITYTDDTTQTAEGPCRVLLVGGQ